MKRKFSEINVQIELTPAEMMEFRELVANYLKNRVL
jgi:hypothetical protein